MEYITDKKVSLILPSYLRPELLELGLRSIASRMIRFDFEVIVVNDGLEDDTRLVCERFNYNRFNVKYIFTGQRNSKDNMIYRNPAKVLNIGIKASTGDILVLSCPEMYHVDSALTDVVLQVINNPNAIGTPQIIHFDNDGQLTDMFAMCNLEYTLDYCQQCPHSSQMPFLMAVWKDKVMQIGGYDEDYNDGYAGEDNDLMDRLHAIGCRYSKVDTKVVHLYHGPRCSGEEDWDNPKWVFSYNLRKAKMGTIVRNEGREWGVNESI